jgi:hypothetical protein
MTRSHTVSFQLYDETMTKLRDTEQKLVQAKQILWDPDIQKRLNSVQVDRIWEFLRSIETCPECNAYDRVHDESCYLHPDHDGAPKE